MKKLLIAMALFGGLIAGTILLIYMYSGHRLTQRRQELERTFASNRATFDQLKEAWQRLPLKMDSCGKPDISPGLVHFAVLEHQADGTIRVGQDNAVQTVSSAKLAAGLLNVNIDTLSTQLRLMDSVSITSMFQHEAQLDFVQDDDSSLELIYVPPLCKTFQNYVYWADNGNVTFANIRQIAPSWFMAQVNR